MSEADSTSRRRPPTIDLTAKEVESASAEPNPAAEAEPAKGAPESAPAPSRNSSGRAAPYVIGIAVGAVGVAAIAAASWFAGLLPVRDASAPATLGAVAPASPSPVPVAQGAANATDEISARLDRIEQALRGPPRTDAALAGRVAAAEAQAKSLGDSLAALTRRVDELAATAQSALADAKAAAAAADAAKDAAKDAARDAAKNAAQSATQSGAQRTDIEALETRIVALQNALKSLDADVAQRASSSNADDRVMRLAIAAEALRATVERGASFQAELAAVKALGADSNATARLEPFAAEGLTSAAELGRDLIALTPALARAMEPEPSNNSILATLESHAQRLVHITPVGTSAAPAGDDPAALIARLDANAARGDIDAALAEIAKLPNQAQAVVQAWTNKAGARRAALAESRLIAAQSLSALAKSESR